jgi:hypothetical protein
MPQPVLKRAAKLFRRRKFSAVIRLLEQQVFRFRDSFEFYALLGLSCLHSGDTGGAFSYLKRADQLRADDVPVLLGLAAAAIQRSDTDEALENWLRVLDLQPGNRAARRGLALLRQVGSGSSSLTDAIEKAGVRRLLQPIPPDTGRIVVPAAIVLLIAAGLILGYYLLPRLPADRGRRTGIPRLSLAGDRPALTDETPGAFYTLTDRETRMAFERARGYLADYRDNLAVREINRLLRSNAVSSVKEKARVLASFVRQPDFSTVRDPFSYPEVARDPPLYHGAFAVWRGKVANLSIGEERIGFDLLVGYQDQKELLGIVPVSFDFAVGLENGATLEVLGRIQSESGEIRLQGISLHRIAGK